MNYLCSQNKTKQSIEQIISIDYLKLKSINEFKFSSDELVKIKMLILKRFDSAKIIFDGRVNSRREVVSMMLCW